MFSTKIIFKQVHCKLDIHCWYDSSIARCTERTPSHQHQERCRKSPLLNGYIKQKRRSLISLRNEYGNLFDHVYRMDYASFQHLHELLKDGILQYIRRSNSSQNYSPNPSFFIRNGNITTEIHLACALRYFAGGSCLDITMSHAIRVTDFYLSVWAIVDAMNRCPSLNFQFPTTESECQVISTEFAARSKAGFTNCIGCIDGLLSWLEKPSKKQCEQVGVDTGKFYCG